METLIGLHDTWSIYRNSWLISNPGEILRMKWEEPFTFANVTTNNFILSS